MKRIKFIGFGLLFFCSLFFVQAQYTDVINSNRPSTSKSAFSVGTNVLQFEAGGFSVNETHSLLNYDVSGFGGNFSARYGLFFPQLEINIESDFQSDTFTDKRSTIPQNTKRSNFKQLTIGAKFLVYDPYKNAANEKPNLYSYHANRRFKWKHLIPAVSIYAGANFDSKDNPFTAPDIEGFSPKVMVATQHNFTGGWVFVTNIIKDHIGSEYSEFEYLITLTKSIGRKWAVFAENHGIKSDFYADNLISIGGGYLWNKNFQIDTAVTFNTKNTPTVLNIGLGASYRFDFHKDKAIDNNNSAKDELKRKNNKNAKKIKPEKKSKKKTESIDFEDEIPQ